MLLANYFSSLQLEFKDLVIQDGGGLQAWSRRPEQPNLASGYLGAISWGCLIGASHRHHLDDTRHISFIFNQKTSHHRSRTMGLTMEDSNISSIHVPSGPTTYSHEKPNYDNLNIQQLIVRKDNLEEELKALGSVLDHHKVTMTSTLTTFDGFPRADIDVAQVRTTRARIIHLRNDWKDLMAKIEKALHEHHEPLIEADKNRQMEPEVRDMEVDQEEKPPAAPEVPFARVKSVEDGSPANEAGMKADDLIRRFGMAIWSNHDRLRKVGEVVAQNSGKPILVQIQRKKGDGVEELDLRLTPRSGWGGRGQLGCFIVPV